MDFAALLAPGPASNTPTTQSSLVTPSAAEQSATKALNPENPLLAFGVLAAITFGLMAFSTSVRVGHTSANLSIGDT
jgi:hypothetical protein